MGAAEVVDAERGHVGLAGVERERHKRESAPLRHLHQQLASPAAQQEAVHQSGVDAPGQGTAPGHRDERQARTPLVADGRDLGQQPAHPGIAEEVGQRLGGQNSDGVDLARSEEGAPWGRVRHSPRARAASRTRSRTSSRTISGRLKTLEAVP